MSDNETMKGIFGYKTEGVTEGLKKLHDEELHNLYSSPHRHIIRVMKSRSMKWAGIVARMR
jgi:hypothetical protein